MGDYLTTAEVEARAQQTLRAHYLDGDAVNEDWIGADIETVEGEINAYLAGRYVVPVSGAATGLLRGFALTLFQEQAYLRKPSASVPEALAAAAKRVREQLQAIADGKLSLGAATVPSERTARVEAIVIEGNTPTRTKSKLAGL